MPRFHQAKEGDKIPISDYNLKSKYLEALVNMKVSGGIFKINTGGATLAIDSGVQTEVRWAKLLEDLPVADTDAINTPSTADAVFLVGSSSGDEPLVETDENNPITITNRDTEFSASTGDVLLICRVHLGTRMEWSPLFTGSPAEEVDDGFPPGTGGCACGNCFQGVTMPNALECCTSHPSWSLKNPWLTCVDTDLVLELESPDVWLTEPFMGPACGGEVQNEYRWRMTINVTNQSLLELVLATDNGCEPVCVVYWRDGFECQCDNAFSLSKPHGTFIGNAEVLRNEFSCYACVKAPEVKHGDPDSVIVCTSGAPGLQSLTFPQQFSFVFPGGFTGAPFCTRGGFCDSLGGTYSVTLNCAYDANARSYCDEYVVEGHPAFHAGVGASYQALWVGSTASGDPPTSGCDLILTVGLRSDAVGGTGSGFVFARVFDVRGTFPYDCAGAMYYLRGITIPETQQEVNDLLYFPITLTKEYEEQVCTEAFPDTITLIPSNFIGVLVSPVSDGVCNETCDPDAVPPDTNPGACCLQGTCYDRWDEELCSLFEGVWQADGCGTCDENGACCVSGECLITREWLCDLIYGGGGVWHHGQTCEDVDCSAFGACCSATDGSCSLLLETECQAPNYWGGVGTDCDPDPCAALGACCHNNAAATNCTVTPCECWLLTEAACNAKTGTILSNWAGAGTICITPGYGADCDCRGADCDFA